MQEISRVLAAAQAAERSAAEAAELCRRLGSMAAQHRRWTDDRLRVLSDRLDKLHSRLLDLTD